MVLSDNDIVPYQENIEKLKTMMLKEIEGSDLYLPMDKDRCREVGGITYYRVLMSNKNDIEASFKYMTKSLKWRKENNVDTLKQEDFSEDILNYKAFKMYMGDKEGNTILIFDMKEHTRNFIPKDIFRKYLVYWVDVLFKINKYQQATIIMNLKGSGLSNMDVPIILTFLDTFKTHYPQAIAHILVVGMHWLYEAAYKIIKPFIPTEMNERLRFLNKMEDLKEYADEENLTPELGGVAKFDPLPLFIHYKQYVEAKLSKEN